jgi:hypothetical protein
MGKRAGAFAPSEANALQARLFSEIAQTVAELPFSIGFLDREERLPLLLPRAA